MSTTRQPPARDRRSIRRGSAIMAVVGGERNPVAWQALAACKGHPKPGIFFPDSAENSKVSQAKKVCGQCPVRVMCLAYALATEPSHDHGIWGGTTERERAEMRKRQAGIRQQAAATLAAG